MNGLERFVFAIGALALLSGVLELTHSKSQKLCAEADEAKARAEATRAGKGHKGG